MRSFRDEAQLIDAARRFSRYAVRGLLLLYLTGGVLLLPGFLPSAGPQASEGEVPDAVTPALGDGRGTLVATHVATTVVRGEPPKARERVVKSGDTLDSIAKEFGVKAETVAYNNGIRAYDQLAIGATLVIPPFDGAVYEIKEGDTVEAIASRFGVESRAVMEANRLYFEPEIFSPGAKLLVPVPSATFPDFELARTSPAVARANPVSRGAAAATVRAPGGRLMWPVAGRITQYYSGSHLGVDIAAPYASAIGASDAGTVSAVGWVAIGGLRVCVRHDWGLETCYYHTSATFVVLGQRVARGQVVAAIGLTGVTTGPHVHWEANVNGRLVNPLAY